MDAWGMPVSVGAVFAAVGSTVVVVVVSVVWYFFALSYLLYLALSAVWELAAETVGFRELTPSPPPPQAVSSPSKLNVNTTLKGVVERFMIYVSSRVVLLWPRVDCTLT
jgi:hypothetical protein